MGMFLKMKGCIAAVALCAVSGSAFAQPAQPLRKVNVALAGGSMIAVIPRFAKEMGLFERRGLDPTFIVMDSASAGATALLAGSVEYAFSGPAELITARARGRDVVTIANTYGGLGGSLVLSKETVAKLGVSPTAPLADRLKALNGLTIASPSATSVYTITYRAAAQKVGATPRFTYMAQTAMQAALESGAVQGISGSAPFWAMPLLSGKGVLWIAGPGGDMPSEFRPRSNSVLLAMRDTVKNNPDITARLAGVFTDFAEAVEKRPAVVKAAVAKTFPNLDARTIDMLYETESLAWKSKPLTAADVAAEIAYVKATGINVPGLEKVDPAAAVWP